MKRGEAPPPKRRRRGGRTTLKKQVWRERAPQHHPKGERERTTGKVAPPEKKKEESTTTTQEEEEGASCTTPKEAGKRHGKSNRSPQEEDVALFGRCPLLLGSGAAFTLPILYVMFSVEFPCKNFEKTVTKTRTRSSPICPIRVSTSFC